MIRPFFEKLTVSEIHAVCTGGFATIAGSVMAAYIIYGVRNKSDNKNNAVLTQIEVSHN